VTTARPEPASRADPIADAIVVAGGASTRMAGLDKVTLPIGGRPIVAIALDAFQAAPEVATIVLVTGAEQEQRLADAGSLSPDLIVVRGGARRQESVARGWEALEQTIPDPEGRRVVLVHDGARPLVTAALIGRIARAAGEHGAAIPVVPVGDTLKRIEDGRVAATVDRASVVAAQTPQGVSRALLREAYTSFPAHGEPTFTDEAALLEACKIAVHAIAGEPSNVKVTVPDDLRRVAAGVGGRSRVGYGHDRHSFGPGEPLMLGGLEFAGAPRLHGHSDGDVALHAAADALLGAAGLGDLGRLFPSDERTPRGIASTELLREVADQLATAGYRAVSLDLTIVGARPRLAPRLPGMRESIAGLLDVPGSAVSVKAATGNLGGAEGEGRAIAAHAVACLEPAEGRRAEPA
jgi:2-C-methyl-D-erythritol 4-phosphate cytidylyltransferase / 2-C-methyl-D-erythritol 2,4-cyclodiphosphate synthase